MTNLRKTLLALAAGVVVLGGIVACSPLGTLNALSPGKSLKTRADVAYGENARHKLDIYTPEKGAGDAPVLDEPAQPTTHPPVGEPGGAAQRALVGEDRQEQGVALGFIPLGEVEGEEMDRHGGRASCRCSAPRRWRCDRGCR